MRALPAGDPQPRHSCRLDTRDLSQAHNFDVLTGRLLKGRGSIWIGAPTCHLSDPRDLCEGFGNRALPPHRRSLDSLSAAAACTGDKTIPASKRRLWVLPSFNGPGVRSPLVIWVVVGPSQRCLSLRCLSLRRGSGCQLFLVGPAGPKHSVYMGRQLTNVGRTSAVQGQTVELTAHVLRAQSCQSDGSCSPVTGSCCLRR